MHITLALNYDKADSVTFSTLFGRFENVDASSWELRLYSRDIRIGSKQVTNCGYLSNCYLIKLLSKLKIGSFHLGVKSNTQLSRTSL